MRHSMSRSVLMDCNVNFATAGHRGAGRIVKERRRRSPKLARADVSKLEMEKERAVIKSAKRTAENSPAIHRWGNGIHQSMQSAKRTAEILQVFWARIYFQSSVSRARVKRRAADPALKCWANFERPLRGLCFICSISPLSPSLATSRGAIRI